MSTIKNFFPHELYLIVDKFSIGRRVDFLTTSKAIDLLRFITSNGLTSAGGIKINQIQNVISLLGDTSMLTTAIVAQLYGDPAKREKTPRVLTSTQVKDVVDRELNGETQAMRLAITAFIIFIMNGQGLIEEKKTLAIDALFDSPFVIDNFTSVEEDIVLVRMAEAIEQAAKTKQKLRMSNVVTLAESIREIFREFREAISKTITRAPYLNTLFSMIRREVAGKLEEIYLESPAYQSARVVLNFYLEPEKFKEVPFEYATVGEYNNLLKNYFLSTESRFGLMSVSEISAMFNVDRYIHSSIRELFGVIIRKNLDTSEAHSGLVTYFHHDNLYIYSKLNDDTLSQVEQTVISEDANLVKTLLSNTHNLRMDLEPSNRALFLNFSLTLFEQKLLAMGLSDVIVLSTQNLKGVISTALHVELNVNSNLNQDIYTELLNNPAVIPHANEQLLSPGQLRVSGDESRITTNSMLYPILYSLKSGGTKAFRTKTESVEKFIDKSIFINAKHTSSLAERNIKIKIAYIDINGVRQTAMIDESPAKLLDGLYALDYVAVLGNIRNQIVNVQDAGFLANLLEMISDPSLSGPTRNVLVRNLQKHVIDTLRKLNSVPWLKQFAAQIIMSKEIPITRTQIINTQFNKISALATAYAIIFKFIMNRDSLLFTLVQDHLVVDSSILSNLDPKDLVL